MAKKFPIMLIILFLLALLLRFATLGRNSLWFDEAWGVFRATQPVKTTLAGNIEVGRPPLYYVGLHYWINWFGRSETAVRFPSALASLLSVPLVYLLGRQISTRRVALLAMGLLAFSPLHVWYAQEVRMYIFIACLGLVAANGLAWGHWLAILPTTIALTAGLYVDFPMVPVWIGISATFFVYWWVKGRPKTPIFVWLISTTLAVLFYQPWWSRLATLLTLLNNIHVFLNTRRALNLPEFSATQYVLMMGLAGLGLTLFFALVYKLMQQNDFRRFVTPFILLLFLLLTVAFVWPRLFGVKRVLATGWPYVSLFVAWLVVAWEGKKQWIGYGLMGISLVATIVMLSFVPKDDWRNAVAYINNNAQAGDVVWIDPPWNNVAYDYYGTQLPASAGNQENLEQLAGTDTWLLAERFPGQTPPSSVSETWLDDNLQLVEVIPFYRLEVRHYRPET